MHLRTIALLAACFSLFAAAQQPTTLTLQQAEDIALKNQPRLAAAELRARAAGQQVRQARAAYLPTLGFNATGTLVADTNTAMAAGNLPTSAVSDRFAYGGNLSQMVTDFGRTSALVGSAKAREQGRVSLATFTRSEARLAVRQAYAQALGAEAVLRAAQAALKNRQLVSRQIGALADSQLRSTLDVNFAHVLESQAELAVVQAKSLVAQRRAQLATAMGEAQPITAQLTDVDAPTGLPPDPTSLLPQAAQNRADLQTLRSDAKAAKDFAKAEGRLQLPTLNVLGSAGQLPYHDHTLHDSYASAGFNLNIPLFNGWLFSARKSEADFEAQARQKDLQSAQLNVNQQVVQAWQQANEALQSLDVSQRLLQQSQEALRLADARYRAGLSGIVELNQAQLNETSAEITLAQAKYTYVDRRALLDFASGALN